MVLCVGLFRCRGLSCTFARAFPVFGGASVGEGVDVGVGVEGRPSGVGEVHQFGVECAGRSSGEGEKVADGAV